MAGRTHIEPSLRDNIAGDWMSKQLVAEWTAKKKVSEMFQLKMEHKYSCEAELIKQFHESHCDSGEIDTGVAK